MMFRKHWSLLGVQEKVTSLFKKAIILF